MNWKKISIFVFAYVCPVLSYGMIENLSVDQLYRKQQRRFQEKATLKDKIDDLIKNKKNLDEFRYFQTIKNCWNKEMGCIEPREFISDGFPLLQAVSLSDSDLIELLLKNGADVNCKFKVGNKITTAMHCAAGQGDYYLMPLLIQYGASVNSLNKKLQTPLHVAVKYTKTNILQTIEFLIKKGAGLDFIDSKGITPLMLAAENFLDPKLHPVCEDKFAVVRLLIQSGSNFNLKDFSDKKVIDFIKEKKDKIKFQEILFEHEKRIKNNLLENTSISQDPIIIILDYLIWVQI